MIRFTIFGEPASKANSRELATIGRGDNRRTILRKGDKALVYERDALKQMPPAARARLQGPVRVTLRDVLQDRWKTYKVGNGDSDRTLVQAGVYRNDRQVREKHVFHGIDRRNPRAEVIVEPLQAQQADLLGVAA